MIKERFNVDLTQSDSFTSKHLTANCSHLSFIAPSDITFVIKFLHKNDKN